MSRDLFGTRLASLLLAVLAALLAGCAGMPAATPAAPPQGLNAPMGPGAARDARTLILVTMRSPDHEALTGKADVSQTPLPGPYQQLLQQWETRYGIRRVADWALRSLPVRCMVFEVGAGRTRDAVLRELAAAPLVETVQPLQEFAVAQSAAQGGAQDGARSAYNDPYLRLQHGFETMAVAAAHRWATGRGVRIAIIDTGLDSQHPELLGRVTLRRNLVDGDLTTFDADVHGTAVAAVIAASANNAVGLVGVAPEVELIALKACWQDGPGYGAAVCNSFTLAKALDVAVTQQVDIINLSLGGPADPLLSRLVARAQAQDTIVVGSVDPRFPAGFPAAAAGVLAAESEQRTRGGAASALRAPGDKVVSARPQGQYDLFSGSSVAAAQISGIAALARQRKPHLPGSALATLLKSTADAQTGSVNACRALARVAAQDEALCR